MSPITATTTDEEIHLTDPTGSAGAAPPRLAPRFAAALRDRDEAALEEVAGAHPVDTRDELVAADHKDCTKADLLMMLEYVYICYTGEEP